MLAPKLAVEFSLRGVLHKNPPFLLPEYITKCDVQSCSLEGWGLLPLNGSFNRALLKVGSLFWGAGELRFGVSKGVG